MKIQNGGWLSALGDIKDKQLSEVNIFEENGTIQLWLNGDSLSYMTLQEAIGLRNELNAAIKKVAGV